MAVSRGKNPTAKGGLGAVLGLAREAPDGCGITEIAVCVVDGKRYLPDVYYDVNGNEVLGTGISSERSAGYYFCKITFTLGCRPTDKYKSHAEFGLCK